MPTPSLNLVLKAIRNSNDGGSDIGLTNVIPDDWINPDIHNDPANFGYHPRSPADSTDDQYEGYVRYNRNTITPWNWQNNAHGGGGNTSYDGGAISSKMMRRVSNGGKYVIANRKISGSPNTCINFAWSSACFNVNFNLNDASGVSYRSNGTLYDKGTYKSSPTEQTSWADGDTAYVFIDFDNMTLQFSVNGGALYDTVDISSAGNWCSVHSVISGDNNDRHEFICNPDLSAITTFPTGTTEDDWTGWNDWEQYQTEYTILGFPNEVDSDEGWRFFSSRGGIDYVAQGVYGGVDFTDIIVSPSITMPVSANVAIVGQQAHDTIPNLDNGFLGASEGIEVDVRQNGSVQRTFIIEQDAASVNNYHGSGISHHYYYFNEGDVIDVTATSFSTAYNQIRSLGDFYLIVDSPSGGSQPPAPEYDPLSVDVDVSTISGTQANGDFTSSLLTATVTGGSGQFLYSWTTDGEATFSDSDGISSTASWTDQESEDVDETITFTVTDIGNNDDTATDTVTVDLTFGYAGDYIAYWEFEDEDITGLVVDDLTSNSYDLTMQENPVLADGANGTGIALNASQYGTVSGGGFTDTEFTLSTWVKPDSTVIGDFLFQSGDFSSAPFAGWNLFRTSSNALRLSIGNNSGSVFETDYTNVTTVSNIVNPTQYRHVAVVYSGTNMKIYVNSTQVANKDWTGITYPTSNVTTLGSANGLSPFNGDMDMTKYFDRALSSVEIAELYNEPRTPGLAPVPFGLSVSPQNIVRLVFPNGAISNTQTATATGGSGSFTYQWTKVSGDSGYDITSGATSPTVTIGGTGSGEETYVFRVVVTDTGNGNITEELTTTHTINWGAV